MATDTGAKDERDPIMLLPIDYQTSVVSTEDASGTAPFSSVRVEANYSRNASTTQLSVVT